MPNSSTDRSAALSIQNAKARAKLTKLLAASKSSFTKTELVSFGAAK